ncbi:MAG TPA: phosphate ABC transporter permease PstA [Acetobacteraceae bacterium]|nr:phosphate ABC transporter permease PstA [Acetobacteraceae bacterium]
MSALPVTHGTALRRAADRSRQRRREWIDAVGWALCAGSLIVLGGAILWILGMVLVRGIGALTPAVFTQVTQGTGGGLLNAIEGTVAIAAGTLILAVPFGMAAGIYVAEYRWTYWARTIRFLADVLVGVPSIVLGYFGYITMVEWLGWHFSIAAASITLAVLCLPYICRTTEMALREVPAELREAGYALGAGAARVTFGLSMRYALPAVVTGVLLALAISVGETAPLLYTAGWSNYLWNFHLVRSPIGYLTYVIWAFINEPFASANALAYVAALLTTAFVLVISLASRLLLLRRK